MNQEKIFSLLLEEDDVTWQTIIYDLVKTEQMDPWDIDVSLLSQKFLAMVKKLKSMDFRVSGKIILAAAILLKIKSKRLMEYDITNLDALINSTDELSEEEFFEELEEHLEPLDDKIRKNEPTIVPRTPQPRKRKVSVFDLVEALEKALEVKNRRNRIRSNHPEVKPPEKVVDMGLIIKEMYGKIVKFFKKNKKDKLTFTMLLPSYSKEDQVLTLIPLLHLDNQRKIDLFQQQHFGEIEVELLNTHKKAAKT
ncbi:hypothetical protein D6745_00820 [Candidatus Woesearchaeota archaeon]|nr:MAG: hypothetical protein D6745_00820 [Candidatus Woesearchaeota archaeon]